MTNLGRLKRKVISTFNICHWCGHEIMPPEYPVIAIPFLSSIGVYYFHQGCWLYFGMNEIGIEKEKQKRQNIGETAHD